MHHGILELLAVGLHLRHLLLLLKREDFHVEICNLSLKMIRLLSVTLRVWHCLERWRHLLHWWHHWHLQSIWAHAHHLRSHELTLMPHMLRVHHLSVHHPWVRLCLRAQSSLVFVLSVKVHLLSISQWVVLSGLQSVLVLGSWLLGRRLVALLQHWALPLWLLKGWSRSLLQQLFAWVDSQGSRWVSVVHLSDSLGAIKMFLRVFLNL